MKNNLIKFYRFYRLYGFIRAYVKAVGRLRSKYIITLPIVLTNKRKYVAIVGCGQFSFATIGLFLRGSQGAVIKKCFDIDVDNSSSFANYYKTTSVQTIDEIINDKEISLVYIASNHASHTDYAIMALRKGKSVYIEKPISTTFKQFELLNEAISKTSSEVYVGYNRPFSKAITEVKKCMPKKHTPITLNCFVIGHVIPPEHWYRRPEEGSRVCGNLGHWIDLTIHILSSYKIQNTFDILITYSNVNESDDNMTVTIVTENADLITLTLTSRAEPFEGINETINLQAGDLFIKIDDFRRMNIWQNEKHLKRKYFRKDVGHKGAVLQPFSKEVRNWLEVKTSTILMLFIADMVKKRVEKSTFLLNEFLKD